MVSTFFLDSKVIHLLHENEIKDENYQTNLKMPIVNSYIKKELAKKTDFQRIIIEWSELLNVEEKDITLNLITDFKQFGKNNKVMINLFLPSLWSQSDIERIQRILSELLQKHLNIKSGEILIMTSIIESGCVHSNGKTEKWE